MNQDIKKSTKNSASTTCQLFFSNLINHPNMAIFQNMEKLFCKANT